MYTLYMTQIFLYADCFLELQDLFFFANDVIKLVAELHPNLLVHSDVVGTLLMQSEPLFPQQECMFECFLLWMWVFRQTVLSLVSCRDCYRCVTQIVLAFEMNVGYLFERKLKHRQQINKEEV
eukprot:m.281601 g.281601  ORF g.281601 m.281601 type:complete len:123 (-) comp16335_c0_seq5:82-450(-)